MKFFDGSKKRRHLEVKKSEVVVSNKLSKSGWKETKIAESLVEENEGNIQLLGEENGVIYLVSSIGTKDIKYKKSYIRHIGYFEQGCEGRVLNMYYGVSSSNKLNEISDTLSKEFKNGITEDDILFSKEIMRQLLVLYLLLLVH